MPTGNIVVVTRFLSTAEAEIAQAALGNEGISSFVEAAESNIILSHMGAGLRGVKLLVDEENLQAAREIVLQEFEQSGPDHEWPCPNCSATVDAGFSICWSCGGPFDPSLPIA